MTTPFDVPWWNTELGEAEIDGVAKAILGRHINQGELCSELERQLAQRLGVPHVAMTTSGSAALALSLMACGVGRDDEVILPALSYIATAHAVLLAGARVRLVDVRPDRPLIDPALIEAAITPRTKAILPVHLNGAACNMAAIRDIRSRASASIRPRAIVGNPPASATFKANSGTSVIQDMAP